MTSYAERYRAGEREKVWEELSALGARVFDEPIHADALEVARETMRRARQNIEMLIERLQARGYRFADSVSAAEDRLSNLDMIGTFSAQMKAIASARPGGLHPQAQNVLDQFGAMQSKFAPFLDKIRSQATSVASEERKPPLEDLQVFCPPNAETPKLIAQLEKEARGPLPLSLRAWYEEVGGVSLMGSDAVLNPGQDSAHSTRTMVDQISQALATPRTRAPGESLQDFYARLQGGFQMTPMAPDRDENSLPDPLVIFPIEELLDQLSEQERDGTEDKVELVIAPDDLHKANISGDAYYLTLPDAQADFRFGDWHAKAFVDYLRAVFRWGGFPGWERSKNPPLEAIAELSEGLLPI